MRFVVTSYFLVDSATYDRAKFAQAALLATGWLLENKKRTMCGGVKMRWQQPYESTYSQAPVSGDCDHGAE
jgi:hypothetical protein